MKRINKILLLVAILMFSCNSNQQHIEKIESLEQNINWYQDAKFGMFIHWGLYSVAGKHEWFRYQENTDYDEYHSLANQFNPTKFDAEAWVKTAKSAGMKWITITAKHHDGFAIYNSKADTFSINSTPFGEAQRDPLKELSVACKKHGIKLGFYYSHYQDWDHPGGGLANLSYQEKRERPFTEYIQKKALPQVKELLTDYGDIAVIWFDTPMHLSNEEVEQFRTLVRETSPSTLIGGRLDDATGDFWSMPDNKVPDNPFGEPWETCMTSNHAWSWRVPKKETRPAKEMIRQLCKIVSNGGNFLLNTGPSPTGELNINDVNEFKNVGDWLKVNGESIYETKMNPFFESPYTCTTKGNKLYFHLFNWPKGSFKVERIKNNIEKAWLLNDPKKAPLDFQVNNSVLNVNLPVECPDSVNTVLVIELDGVPEIQNSYPTNNQNDVINISADKISRVDKRFTSYNKDLNIVGIKDSRRAWVNGWYKVNKPGKYKLLIEQASTRIDSGLNNSYWFRTNGIKKVVELKYNDNNEELFSNVDAGIIQFDNKGVYNFTIRPVLWNLNTKHTLVKIKNIKLVKLNE